MQLVRSGSLALTLLVILSIAPTAHAQIFTVEGLWPQVDGASWTFDGTLEEYPATVESFTARLIFDGPVDLAGGVTALNLIGQVNGLPAAPDDGSPSGLSPVLRTVWRLRPELRSALETRYVHAARSPSQRPMWPLELLQPAEAEFGLGSLSTTTVMGTWRDGIANWAWWYFTDAFSIGSEWTLQLIPDIADDVFLHGRVFDQFTQIDVGGQTYTNVLVMEYTVDFGEITIVDQGGQLTGSGRAETTGRVSFGMDVGPLRMFEDFAYTQVNCPLGCPEEDLVGVVLRHGSLDLISGPIATSAESWGSIKSRF
jgi:hypothetical protein